MPGGTRLTERGSIPQGCVPEIAEGAGARASGVKPWLERQETATHVVMIAGYFHAAIKALPGLPAIAAGVACLWGPAHGGANEACLNMLEDIQKMGGVAKVGEFMNQVKDKNSGVKLMGFGHRVYKNYDPRARIIKQVAEEVFEVTGRNPKIDITDRVLKALAEGK